MTPTFVTRPSRVPAVFQERCQNGGSRCTPDRAGSAPDAGTGRRVARRSVPCGTDDGHRRLPALLLEELLQTPGTHAGCLGDLLDREVATRVRLDVRECPTDAPGRPSGLRTRSPRGPQGRGRVLAEPVPVGGGEPTGVGEPPSSRDRGDAVVADRTEQLAADAVEPVVPEEPVRRRAERPGEHVLQSALAEPGRLGDLRDGRPVVGVRLDVPDGVPQPVRDGDVLAAVADREGVEHHDGQPTVERGAHRSDHPVVEQRRGEVLHEASKGFALRDRGVLLVEQERSVRQAVAELLADGPQERVRQVQSVVDRVRGHEPVRLGSRGDVGAARLDHAGAVGEVHLESAPGEPEDDVVGPRRDDPAAATVLGAHGAERDVLVADDRVLVPRAVGHEGVGPEVAAVHLGREDARVVDAVVLGEAQPAEAVRRRGAHLRIMPALSAKRTAPEWRGRRTGGAWRARLPASRPSRITGAVPPGIPRGGTLLSTPEVGMQEHAHVGYIDDKDDLLKRLRRAEGQVRGIARMVEDETYCIDVLTQISAANRALERVALSLLEDHLRHCVAEAVAEGGDAADAKVREASDAIARLVRS
ncbi:transcriptional regulator [Curtobacterium sp. ER1/6]|nr:transcriptional regulator [Curtobacterium sp. ER1/6]